MISVAAIRMQQFGVQFYQASLTASDIDKLVRFEVLSYQDQGKEGVRGKKKGGPQSKINWDLLERRIASNEKAYQRQIIRKKIDELRKQQLTILDAEEGQPIQLITPGSGLSAPPFARASTSRSNRSCAEIRVVRLLVWGLIRA